VPSVAPRFVGPWRRRERGAKGKKRQGEYQRVLEELTSYSSSSRGRKGKREKKSKKKKKKKRGGRKSPLICGPPGPTGWEQEGGRGKKEEKKKKGKAGPVAVSAPPRCRR